MKLITMISHLWVTMKTNKKVGKFKALKR